MSGKDVFVALTVTTALGVFSVPSAASARGGGGGVISGNTAGVNPVFHARIFGRPPNMECFDRFNTYDSTSGTYLGSDSLRHPCNIRRAVRNLPP
jgi:hypothetical protein